MVRTQGEEVNPGLRLRILHSLAATELELARSGVEDRQPLDDLVSAPPTETDDGFEAALGRFRPSRSMLATARRAYVPRGPGCGDGH